MGIEQTLRTRTVQCTNCDEDVEVPCLPSSEPLSITFQQIDAQNPVFMMETYVCGDACLQAIREGVEG